MIKFRRISLIPILTILAFFLIFRITLIISRRFQRRGVFSIVVIDPIGRKFRHQLDYILTDNKLYIKSINYIAFKYHIRQ